MQANPCRSSRWKRQPPAAPADRRSRRARGAHRHAEISVDDLAAFFQRRDFINQMFRHGKCKADPAGLLLRKDNRGIDANDFAVQAEQRPAGVAGVDLGGGLDRFASSCRSSFDGKLSGASDPAHRPRRRSSPSRPVLARPYGFPSARSSSRRDERPRAWRILRAESILHAGIFSTARSRRGSEANHDSGERRDGSSVVIQICSASPMTCSLVTDVAVGVYKKPRADGARHMIEGSTELLRAHCRPLRTASSASTAVNRCRSSRPQGA